MGIITMFLLNHVLFVIISVCIFQTGDGYNLNRTDGTSKDKILGTGAANKRAPTTNHTAAASNSSFVPDQKYDNDLEFAKMLEMAQQIEMEQAMENEMVNEMEQQLQYQPGMEFHQGFQQQGHQEGHHHVHINIDVD